MEKNPKLEKLDQLSRTADELAEKALKRSVVLVNLSVNPDIDVTMTDESELEDLAKNVILSVN